MDYKSKRWKHVRESVLRRDNYMCQESLRYGRRVQADTVHHIFPVSLFPEYQWCRWNLISLCSSEHDAMHIRGAEDLTDKGRRLLERTARANGIEYPPPE